jgi:iron complex outermembrane receptor protein
MFKFGLTYLTFNYIHTAIELQYETERITVYRTKTKSFFLTNINFSTKPLFKHLKFYFTLRNIFDISYKTPAGFEHKQSGITQNGRSFVLRIEYKL